jgi:hypothetical protein
MGGDLDRRLANPRRRVGRGPVRRRVRAPLHPVPPAPPPTPGVRDYLTQAFADEQRIDEVRFGTPVVQGDRAWVEYWARFLDQQGTAMTLAGCAMARFAGDGRIAEARDYWHLEHGHRPPPQQWGR